MDVDTRLLRYFAAVAEEGNLTRAAQRLFVSQPALTKQIRQLEAQLGVTLFTRSRAGMALTDAGRVLAEHTPSLLSAWDTGLRETRSADRRAARVLRVGFVASAANEHTQEIIATFARRRPGWRVDMRQTEWSDPTAGLADGHVDAALLRLPFPGQDAFHVEPLLTEPRWVALPATHRLAHHTQIAFRDLWDEPFVATPPDSGWWRDYWLATDERDDHPARIGAIAHNPDEWLTAIANGYGVSLTPEATARFYQRPGVVYRPVTGVSPSRVGIAWPIANDNDPVIKDLAGKDPKLEAIDAFFAAYASYDLDQMRKVLADDIEWTIPGHHPLSGTKRGVEEVAAFFTQLGKAGFQADPLFLETNDEYVVDIHRGWTTEGVGQVDTLWALVWHFNADGKVDRVVNLSGDQHQMDAFVWSNYPLAPIPARLG